MNPRRFALIGGIIMLAIGICSFFPSLKGSSLGLPVLKVDTSYGLFLNYFPMNIFNKITLIILGCIGIAAANDQLLGLPRSIKFSRWVFAIMGVAAILGLISKTNTLFGYWPLFGNEIGFHAVFAVFGAYYGYMLSSTVSNPNEQTNRNKRHADQIRRYNNPAGMQR